MAYVDVLSPCSYGRFNRKLAAIAGLPVAVYWSAILEVSTKVVKKKKYDEDGYFKLDRKYVEEITSIGLEDQLDCDAVLSNLKVLEVKEGEPNQLRVHLDIMISLLVDDKVKPTETLKKKIRVGRTQGKENKSTYIKGMLCRHIQETEPDDDLAKAYCDWVEVVYEKGIIKKTQVDAFRDDINKYTSDKNVKLEIIKIAIGLSYKLAEWAINKYDPTNANKAGRLPEQRISTELNTQELF